MVKIYDLEGKASGDIKLPKVFSTPYRLDVIKRAVLSQQAARRQAYGSDVLAGKRTSAHYHGRRKYRWAMMNREMSRMSRIHGKVGFLSMRARFVPQAVKGRKGHPPKPEKIWFQKLNKKEHELAIKSALAASCSKELVMMRGHKIDLDLPIVFVDVFESVKKTKDVEKILDKIMPKELERCKRKKVRAGKGKVRGRRYRKKKGPLIIVSKKCEMLKSARNIPGVDVVTADELSAEMLAPGSQPGRISIFTKSAVEKLEKRFGE